MAGRVLIGAQWGDEGKGKIVDLLASEMHHVVRAQGGNNAGHTVVVSGDEYKLHLVPSGILAHDVNCHIAGGVVIDPAVLCQEIAMLKDLGVEMDGRLFVSPVAHVILPYHKGLDGAMEAYRGDDPVGTTRRGIGPCYADKVHRVGIQIGDLVDLDRFKKQVEQQVDYHNLILGALGSDTRYDAKEIFDEYAEYARTIRPLVADVEGIINEALLQEDEVLFEGAQGTFLDNTHGTYPYVTSSSTLSSGVLAGAAVGPTRMSETIGVAKGYVTRVGEGPMPTEIPVDQLPFDPRKTREVGTTTDRIRRIGWFDCVQVKRAVLINGIDWLALTKIDILDSLSHIKVCVGYTLDGKRCDAPVSPSDLARVEPVYEELPGWECSTRECREFYDLPEKAQQYVEYIERKCDVEIWCVSMGPDREETISR